MTATPEKEGASVLLPFRNVIFRRIWGANIASSFGGLIQMTGAAWLMAMISDSSRMVALVQASVALPAMLLSLPAGAIADNYNRRRVMLAAQGFMFVMSVALVAFAYCGLLTPWLLLGFTCLIGIGVTLNNPAWQASVPDVVPRDRLPAAVLLNSVGFNLCRSVAPALGGVVLATGGALLAFSLNMLSYLPLLLVLYFWRPVYPKKDLPRERIWMAMSAGLRYVAMSPNLGLTFLRAFIFGLSAVSVLALLPLVARDLLQGGPKDYGLMLGFFGAGGVAGAFLSSRLRTSFSSEGITRLCFAAFVFCVWGAAWSPHRWASCLALAFGGASWVVFLSLCNVTVQFSAPRWVLARALALYQTSFYAGMAGGSWLWGVTAERFGTQNALIASGFALLGGALLGLRLPLPGLSRLNLDPHTTWKPPRLALNITPQSGRVVVWVEYIIDEVDVPRFLEAMNERRRIRLRDGASNWMLLRDVEDPDRWRMSYQLPTWLEYLRHNQRTTKADLSVTETILALHRGEESPRVFRMIERQTEWPLPDEVARLLP